MHACVALCKLCCFEHDFSTLCNSFEPLHHSLQQLILFLESNSNKDLFFRTATGTSALYLFNSVDDLAIIKFIPILIHDMEHCRKEVTPTTHQDREIKRWKDYNPSKSPALHHPRKEPPFSHLLKLSKDRQQGGRLQSKWQYSLTIHEPLVVGGNVGPIDGQLQIGQHLNHFQQGPILVRAVHLQTQIKAISEVRLRETDRKKKSPSAETRRRQECRVSYGACLHQSCRRRCPRCPCQWQTAKNQAKLAEDTGQTRQKKTPVGVGLGEMTNLGGFILMTSF